jgi:hypothetical protein
MPAVFTETLSVALVVPLGGATASQFPPEVVLAEAVKLSVPAVLATERDCATGFVPPVWPLKLSDPGPTESDGWAETTRVTG